MPTTFITGDRRPGHPVYLQLVAVEMLKAQARGDVIATGDNHGVDAIVREFGERAGVAVDVRTSPRTESGHRDYPAFLSDLDDESDMTEIVVVHLEPTDSRLVAAVASHVDPEHSRIVSLESV